jgi:alanyl-tRNA synthetase
VYSSELLSVDELLKLGFSVINERSGLLLVMKHPETKTCLLLSSSETDKCGSLVREMVSGYNGKGGGRDDNARAVFTALRDMDAFADAVMEQKGQE